MSNQHPRGAEGGAPFYTARYGISVRMLHPNGRGHGARKGHVMHACVLEPGYTGSGGVLRSLCGYVPSYDWSDAYAESVTCPKCLRKIAKQKAEA